MKKRPAFVGFIVLSAAGFALAGMSAVGVRAQDILSESGDAGAGENVFSFEAHNVREIPAPIIKANKKRNPYILLVDKNQQKLYIYKYDGVYHRVRTYDSTTGSGSGDKQLNGDRKTPEGIYFFTDVWEDTDLIRRYGSAVAAQYGIRAFNTNYPNEMDRMANKDGYGIWLHGTDKPERISKPFDTKGCVVVRNRDLDEISEFISLGETPIIIVAKLQYATVNALEEESRRVEAFLQFWRKNWENRDMDAYIASYSPHFESGGRSISQWYRHKKDVLKKYEWIKITLSGIRIFKSDDYYYVEFHQVFQTDSYRDAGMKRLYITEENGALKIITERWEPDESREKNIIS